MEKCSSFKQLFKNYQYIVFAIIFAFLTKFSFGYIYDGYMDIFILIQKNTYEELSSHIIYHYIFFAFLVYLFYHF